MIFVTADASQPTLDSTGEIILSECKDPKPIVNLVSAI
jgi:hypothetical protein